MIKILICPTDFSKASVNAAEYAAKLAKVLNAELLFVNVQRITPVAELVSMAEGIGANVRENAVMMADRLKEMSVGVNKMFKISTDYEVDITPESLTMRLSSFDKEETLIVMGTNGADDMYQYIFGSNTYHLITKTKIPVLVIPENISYGSIKKVVFAWDYSSQSSFSFALLNDFMKAFNPQFVFLHVSKHQTEISEDVFRALRSEITSVLGDNKKVEFEQLFSDDIPESINSYMMGSQSDLLSITYFNRGIVRDTFHGKVAKELCEIAAYPVLVLHA